MFSSSRIFPSYCWNYSQGSTDTPFIQARPGTIRFLVVRKALIKALFCLCETCDVYYYVPDGQMQHGINTMFTGGKFDIMEF